MYQPIEINDWILEIDVEETKKQYLKKWDLCDCLYCLNYYEAMKLLPEKEFYFFNQFGITPSKCNHLSHFDPAENDLHFYIGCYHIVGKISHQPPSKITNSDDRIGINNTLHVGFSNDLEFVPERFTKPVLQLNFEIEVPWVLLEKPD